MKRTVLFAATIPVATIAQAADNGLSVGFDPARLITYGWAAGQFPSVLTARPGDPKLEDLIAMPGSQGKGDSMLVLAHNLSAGAAPTYTTVLDNCREWVTQSNTDQGHLVEVEYATDSMNVVEVYGPKIRIVTIREIADSFTRVCREHPEVSP